MNDCFTLASEKFKTVSAIMIFFYHATNKDLTEPSIQPYVLTKAFNSFNTPFPSR